MRATRRGLSRRLPQTWLLLLFLLLAARTSGQVCDIGPDEEIVFFPAAGHRDQRGAGWEVLVRGCVFEPEKRALALAALMGALKLNGVSVSAAERAVLEQRARGFMVDNERAKRIVVRVGARLYELGKSGADGMFSGTFRVSAVEAQTWQTAPPKIEAVLPSKDGRRFFGTALLVPDGGVTVISDIDDTIKVTSVRDRRAMLRSSFLEPFRPVPGMAEVYSAWNASEGAQFYYVSASPWQLYAPLAEFVISNGFPAGLFELKKVRWKDRSALSLFEDPAAYKTRAIDSLLQRFPGRRFALVGDSGERDPEVYGEMARRFPGRVVRILIRDVTDEPSDSPRYERAFHDLAPGLWQIFRDAAGLEDALRR